MYVMYVCRLLLRHGVSTVEASREIYYHPMYICMICIFYGRRKKALLEYCSSGKYRPALARPVKLKKIEK